MEFEPGPRQRELEAHARAFAEEVLAPAAARLDREGGFPRASLLAAARRGLLGINVPRALGGLEAGAVAYALAVMQLARACAATTVALCVSNMVAEVVTAFGSPEQQRTWVPRLCDGSLGVGAFALSEAGAGSDPAGMRTRARRHAGGWVLDGSKLWITSGSDAGLFVVWARTNEAPGARGISCFLVPGDSPGLVRGQPERKLGLHGSTTTALSFHEIELPDEARLHDEGRGFRVAMMALDGGRIGIASQAIGIATLALERAQAKLERTPGLQLRVERESDLAGTERGDAVDQQLAWHLAEGATEIEAARLLTLRAAWRKQGGLPFGREASIAKLMATERGVAACDRALAVLGAEGYGVDATVERCVRDVRVTTIYEGTSEIQRVVIGREILQRFGGRGASA